MLSDVCPAAASVDAACGGTRCHTRPHASSVLRPPQHNAVPKSWHFSLPQTTTNGCLFRPLRLKLGRAGSLARACARCPALGTLCTVERAYRTTAKKISPLTHPRVLSEEGAKKRSRFQHLFVLMRTVAYCSARVGVQMHCAPSTAKNMALARGCESPNYTAVVRAEVVGRHIRARQCRL